MPQQRVRLHGVFSILYVGLLGESCSKEKAVRNKTKRSRYKAHQLRVDRTTTSPSVQMSLKKKGGASLSMTVLEDLFAMGESFVIQSVLVQRMENYHMMRDFFRVMSGNNVLDNAWTHFATLLTASSNNADGNLVVYELGRSNVAGVYFRRYEREQDDIHTPIQGRSATMPVTRSWQQIREFVLEQQQYRYSFVSKNCKHFVYDFLWRVGGHEPVAFERLCNRIEHGEAVQLDN